MCNLLCKNLAVIIAAACAFTAKTALCILTPVGTPITGMDRLTAFSMSLAVPSPPQKISSFRL